MIEPGYVAVNTTHLPGDYVNVLIVEVERFEIGGTPVHGNERMR